MFMYHQSYSIHAHYTSLNDCNSQFISFLSSSKSGVPAEDGQVWDGEGGTQVPHRGSTKLGHTQLRRVSSTSLSGGSLLIKQQP